MPKSAVRESLQASVVEADAKSGRLSIGLITPGWGSSGYYSAKVLENAATAKIFPAGTRMFLDHPGEQESYDRPERSVRDLAAVLTEDATWDGERLVGEAQVFGPFVPLLTDEDFAKTIGVSIRAWAEATTGEAEGRKGPIITELVEAESVDFVTKAGRGGSILAVLESARPAAVVERAIAHGVSEATANDTREALGAALREAYPGEKSWVWVRDFDATTVWYEHETPDMAAVFAEGYTVTDAGAVTLAGTRVEVRARTVYVPVTASTEGGFIESDPRLAAAVEAAVGALTLSGVISSGDAREAATRAMREFRLAHEGPTSVPAPAGQSTATDVKETNMATTQIEEARLATLESAAERVPTLESENSTLRRDNAVLRARESARPIADEVLGASESLPPSVRSRVARESLERVTVADDGSFDEAAFRTAVEAARTQAETEVAELAESLGAGKPTGFGRTVPAGDGTGASTNAWESIDAHLDLPKGA